MSPRNWSGFLRLCLLASLLAFGPHGVLAQGGRPPDARTLVAEVEANHKLLAEKLRGYTYTLRRVEQRVNKEGKVTKEKIVVTRVFPAANGELISMPLSENGKPVSREKAAREKERVRKALRKARTAKPKGDVNDPWLVTPLFLRVVEFGSPRLERRGDREAVVVDFRPRPDFKPASDIERWQSSFEGTIWVDAADRILFRVEARLPRQFKSGGLLGFLAPVEAGTSITAESHHLPEGVWAPSLLELVFKVNTKRSLAPPARLTEERGSHRRFDASADDPLAGLPDDAP